MKEIYMKSLIAFCLMFSLTVATSAQSGSGDLFPVTFRVDMNEYSGSYSMVNVNGIFNGWCGGCAVMTDDDADGVFELAIDLPAGATEYKFTVDGWDDEENLIPGSECTVTVGEFTNRTLNVTGPETLDIVCWESCVDCENNVNNYDVTFRVDMNDYTESFGMVNVNGIFNGWCGTCTEMTDGDSDGVYEVTVTLPEGTTEYKFTLDGWTTEENLTPGDPCTVSLDSFTNRVLNVTQNETLDVVCWESCYVCGEEPETYDVTFKVNLEDYEGSYDMVNINGTFNDWCGECAVMTDDDADDIYELTVTIPEGINEYKFTLDGWEIEESLTEGDDCTLTTEGFTNRFIDATQDEVLDPVCWEECEDCDTIIGIEEKNNQNKLNIFPVPADQVLFIEIEGSTGIQSYKIYNNLGQLVMADDIDYSNDFIDIKDLQRGFYTISVQSGYNSIIKRFVIER